MNLARQADVWSQLRFNGEPIALQLSHLARVAFNNFNTARGATSVTPAAVKNIDTGILQRKYELLPGRRFGFN